MNKRVNVIERPSKIGSRRRMVLAHEFELLPEHKEHPTGESLTVPDEAYTIQELLEKYVRGQAVPSRQALYDSEDADFDDHDMDKLGSLDPVELDAIKWDTKNKREKAEEQLKLLKQMREKDSKEKPKEVSPSPDSSKEVKP